MATLLERVHEVTDIPFVWGVPSPDFLGHQLYFLEDPDVGRCVLKTLRPEFFRNLAEEDRHVFNRDLIPDILAFYARLRSLGVAVPDYHELVVGEDGQPFEVASWLESNLEQQWGYWPFQSKLQILSRLASLCKIVGEDSVIGIDFHLANFCVRNGEPVYVDFCPPLMDKSSELPFDLLDISRDDDIRTLVRESWYGQFGPLRRLYRW